MSETTTTVAEPKTERQAKLKKAAAKVAKHQTKEKATNGQHRDTVRIRALKALRKRNMTSTEVQTAIGLGHGLKPTLDQEVELGRLAKAAPEKEGNATTYKLTAKGRAFLEKA